jgi:hypothetical protein
LIKPSLVWVTGDLTGTNFLPPLPLSLWNLSKFLDSRISPEQILLVCCLRITSTLIFFWCMEFVAMILEWAWEPIHLCSMKNSVLESEAHIQRSWISRRQCVRFCRD